MQFIHISFVFDEDLKWNIQGYSFCLLANQLKATTIAGLVLPCMRIYYLSTLVGT